MKLFFMDGRKSKAIHTELSRVLEGRAVSVDVYKYWFWKVKAGDFSMGDRVRPGRPLIELPGAVMSLLSDEPFFRLGFSQYDFRRRTKQSKKFWWMISECESSWDDGYDMIWVKPIEENESSKQIFFWKSSGLMKGMNSRTQWLVTKAGSILVTNRIPCLQRLYSIFDQVTFEDLQRVFINWMERLSWVVDHDGAYFQE
jgi:hypothetical protein